LTKTDGTSCLSLDDLTATVRIARPRDTIPDSERDDLELALNVLHLKVLASDVGFPVSLFGTVLMRDELDFKCIYLFQRDRENCQVISSPVSNSVLILHQAMHRLSY